MAVDMVHWRTRIAEAKALSDVGTTIKKRDKLSMKHFRGLYKEFTKATGIGNGDQLPCPEATTIRTEIITARAEYVNAVLQEVAYHGK